MRRVMRDERWSAVLVAIFAVAQLGSEAQADILNVVTTPLAPAPEISVTPPSLSLGCEGAFTITVASAGAPGSTLEISALALTHGYSQGYYGTGFGWDLDGVTPPVSLPNGATLAIPVTFSAFGQTFPSRLELRVDSNAANAPQLFQVYLGAAQQACEATPTPTPTPTHTPTACVGDCDDDGQVTVAELVLGVDMALGRDTADSCRAMDENGDQVVSLVELVRAVGSALEGCACGDREVMERFPSCIAAQTETICLAMGGVWTRVGLSLEPECLCPTGQEGCPCSRATDCLGACVGPLEGLPDDCSAAQGSCTSQHPTVGCWCWFDENGNAQALCAD